MSGGTGVDAAGRRATAQTDERRGPGGPRNTTSEEGQEGAALRTGVGVVEIDLLTRRASSSTRNAFTRVRNAFHNSRRDSWARQR